MACTPYPMTPEGQTQEALVEVTDLLCQLCSAVDRGASMPPEVQDWWVFHQKQDAKRVLDSKIELCYNLLASIEIHKRA